MEIRHLKLVKAVAEYKSLTRAANKLFLTQSALSHQVKEIEEEYKTRLFLRINKQMILTPAGERLLKTADIVLEELEKNNSDIKQLVNNDFGVIRISTQCYTSYHWLAAILKQFKLKNPNVEVRVIADATRKTVEFLEAGKLDIAILNKDPNNVHLNLHSLFEDEMVAVFSKEHSWNKLPYVTPKDFINENYLMYSVNIEESETFNQLFNGTGYFPKKVMKMELTEAIVELVRAQIGVAVLAKWAISPYLNKSDLATSSIGETGLRRTWYAATLSESDTKGYITEFIDLLRENTLKQLVHK